MTHKREQEELLKKKAANGASVVPLIPDREKVGYDSQKGAGGAAEKKAATGASVVPLIPDKEKVGYDSQKGAGRASEEEGCHWCQCCAPHP
jgi:hypothetical protein